jgi:hypothetical protein
MEMLVEIPERVVEHAAALGVPVSEVVAQALGEIGAEPAREVEPSHEGFVRLSSRPSDPKKGIAMIREVAARHTLGGISIKELIEEGRD